MEIKNFETKLFYLLLIIGVISRLFLVVKLPIWHDEFYSIWAANHTISEIVRSIADTVHPPGYYLLLHFWGLVSQHLYWFRLSSVIFFIINIFLFRKFAENLGRPNNPNLLVFLYIFSGYFLTFDWQVRMYTMIVTLILCSVLVLSKLRNEGVQNKKSWVLFALINFFGLYIDYAYIWYFVPTAIFTLIYFAFKKDLKFWGFLNSYILSVSLFLLAYPSFISASASGINGIKWMKDLIHPDFYIPFFLGSHATLFFSLSFFILIVWGIENFIKSKKFNFDVLIISFSAVFSFIITLIYSHFAKPIFHTRSLQIVGMVVIIFYYFGLSALPKITKPYLFITLILCFLFNFVVVNQSLFRSPGNLLISPFPWRDILNSTDLTGIKTVKYKIFHPLVTDKLLYGLEYTLKGNENINRPAIILVKYDPAGDNAGCVKFNDSLMELYKCP